MICAQEFDEKPFRGIQRKIGKKNDPLRPRFSLQQPQEDIDRKKEQRRIDLRGYQKSVVGSEVYPKWRWPAKTAAIQQAPNPSYCLGKGNKRHQHIKRLINRGAFSF